MADISHLHPLMQRALRTGEVPEPDELARLLGRNVNSNSKLDVQEHATSTEDAEADRFRTCFQSLVNEQFAAWLDEHPESGNHVPADTRKRIEADCHRQVEHLLALERGRAEADPDRA